MKDVAWKRRPMLGGLAIEEAEISLREKPGQKYPPVTTRASAAVAPDMDWKTNGVLYGVTFHRYVPRNPLEMRTKRNETTGADMEIPPPPEIPERKISGRVYVRDGEALESAMKEARQICEEFLRAGRPRA